MVSFCSSPVQFDNHLCDILCRSNFTLVLMPVLTQECLSCSWNLVCGVPVVFLHAEQQSAKEGMEQRGCAGFMVS